MTNRRILYVIGGLLVVLIGLAVWFGVWFVNDREDQRRSAEFDRCMERSGVQMVVTARDYDGLAYANMAAICGDTLD